MMNLGNIHFARKDHEEAVKWFTKGAEAGLPDAMFNLGRAVQVETMNPVSKAL